MSSRGWCVGVALLAGLPSALPAAAGPPDDADAVRPRGLLATIPAAATIEVAPTFVVLDSVAGMARAAIVDVRGAAGLRTDLAPLGVDVGVTLMGGDVDVDQPADRRQWSIGDLSFGLTGAWQYRLLGGNAMLGVRLAATASTLVSPVEDNDNWAVLAQSVAQYYFAQRPGEVYSAQSSVGMQLAVRWQRAWAAPQFEVIGGRTSNAGGYVRRWSEVASLAYFGARGGGGVRLGGAAAVLEGFLTCTSDACAVAGLVGVRPVAAWPVALELGWFEGRTAHDSGVAVGVRFSAGR